MITIHDLRAWKTDGTRWTMLTAYDFPTAQILDAAGVPVVLVGDSLGRNVLGYANELPVTMEEMLHHTRAVARGVEHAMVVGDMPFMSFQASTDDGVRNAGRLIKEGGAHAVKIEGPQYELIRRLVDVGIPVMAHIGLTPQSVYGLGGYKVQGRGEAAHTVLIRPTISRRPAPSRSSWRRCPSSSAPTSRASCTSPRSGSGRGTTPMRRCS